MQKTDNYELNLPEAEDFFNIEDFNDNTKKIDKVLESLENPEHDTGKQAEVEELASGESLKVALRKLAKAVSDYISHKADQVAHITAAERTAWNAKLGTEKIAANLTTTEAGMLLDATMGKQLAETDASLQEQISTLNSNFSGIKKQLNAGESAYIYIDDGDWCGGIVLISVWKETSNIRGIYMAQPGNGSNENSYQIATVTALKDNSDITVEAAVDAKYSSVKITNNYTSIVCVRAVALCGSRPEWIL